jgi:hypothetical protein
MAGNPKKRARELQAALQAAPNVDPDELHTAAPRPGAATRGIEPLDMEGGGYAPARARARTRASEPHPMHRGASPGPLTRNSVDQRTAADLATLANQLAPGLTVRLERLRPTWAAGWVEDVPIDDADLGGLLDYLAHEHGGQMYRATVLASDGSQLYTARVPIAGAPRRRGRVLAREAWEGLPEPAQVVAQAPAAQAPQSQLADLVQLMQAMQSQGNARQDAVLGAVREMVNANQRQTHELLTALFQRPDAPQAPNFRAQLAELAAASEALEEVREVLGAGARAPAAAPDDERSGMNRIIERIAADALSQGLRNDAARGQAPSAPAPQQRPQPPARPNHARRVQPRPVRTPKP